MFSGLTLINYNPNLSGALQLTETGHIFTLKTCQRFLVLGYYNDLKPFLNSNLPKSIYYETKAYSYLLETMCGLHSKILAENEVANQFKDAYRNFSSLKLRNTTLLRVLEKLFKDYKYIRREHLLGIGTKSYASIVRSIVNSRSESFSKSRELTILGSGQMAEDLIKICYRKSKIHVIARNEQRLDFLEDQYAISPIKWERKQFVYKQNILVNTIGSKQESLFPKFEYHWKENTNSGLFVDLAEASPFQSLENTQTHQLYSLNHVLSLGSELSKVDLEKVNSAFEKIRELAHYRQGQMAQKPFAQIRQFAMS